LVDEHAPSPPASAGSVPPLVDDPEPLPLVDDPELPAPLAADPEPLPLVDDPEPLPLVDDPELPLPLLAEPDPPLPLPALPAPEPDEPEEGPASVTTVRGVPEQPIPACATSPANTKRTSFRIVEYPPATGIEQGKLMGASRERADPRS
jgi:hypothetical protein